MDLSSAVGQTIRDAAHDAGNAWREAYRTAEEAVRAANSSILDAAGVFRRDSNRARDADERSLEEVEHAPTSATAAAVLAGCENGPAQKAGDPVDELKK